MVKNNINHSEPHGIAEESGDPLWEILGKASTTKPRPAFVRDVLRTIRTEPHTEPALHVFLRWLIPATATATAAVALAFTLNYSSTAQIQDLTSSDITSGFVEAAALDDLLASSASWAWQDVAP